MSLLTRDEAAAHLGVSVDTFDRRIRPHLPYTRIGHRHRWSREDLDTWLQSQKVGPYEGRRGVRAVFNTIHDIVQGAVLSTTSTMMEIKNATGRTVFIQFAPDPDIIIREKMASGKFRNIIAIEVKAGSDFSNIHNRIGEAEKSHNKAKAGVGGYTECWTVVNVDNIDMELARKESPSTNRFYRISDLVAGEGPEYEDFVERLVSLTGITGTKTP